MFFLEKRGFNNLVTNFDNLFVTNRFHDRVNGKLFFQWSINRWI